MDKATYTYSQLSSDSVLKMVLRHYNFTKIIHCKFYLLGLHDNYLISADDHQYVLRIYRNDWRSQKEILFELEVLTFLGSQGAAVSAPLPTKRGEFSFMIDCPEGLRSATLFAYAEGHAPCNEITVEESTLLGRTVATIHNISEPLSITANRPVLETPYLLDESLRTIEPFVGLSTFSYLKTLQQSLKAALPPLARKRGIYGICIGDVNPTNFHINKNNHITIFDFDQCGYGFRAFEIGKFISSIHAVKLKQAISRAFIDGYQEIRPLTTDEIASIPYYEMISVIWVMAIHACNADRIGYKWLEKPFWDRHIAKLKTLESVAIKQ